MGDHIRKINTVLLPAILIGLPIFFYATGDFPRRTLLKESISILSILAFCMMVAQFFLARSNNNMLSGLKLGNVIKIHTFIGYIFTAVLLVHPLLIVIPRYFEAGVDSMDALFTIITTFSSRGVVLGIISWCLMFILAVTSLLRNKLPLTYKKWRISHGILAIFVVTTASWHAIDLGRHTDQPLSCYIIVLAVSGVLPLLKSYVVQSSLIRKDFKNV
mgnify:CR=1 FL=1